VYQEPLLTATAAAAKTAAAMAAAMAAAAGLFDVCSALFYDLSQGWCRLTRGTTEA
jgi:hypothetical protein